MLKTNVFAGSISNLTDARYFAARGAQYLCFNLDEAADLYISPEKAAAIMEWVEGPAFIGTFQMADVADIQILLEKLNLQMIIQTGPFIPMENLKDNKLSVFLIRELVIEQLANCADLETTLESLSPVFDFVLLNFEKNGITWTMIKENQDYYTLLKNWSGQRKLIIALAHDYRETPEIIDSLNPFGLYLQGGEEEKTGYKSFDELDNILDALEEDN